APARRLVPSRARLLRTCRQPPDASAVSDPARGPRRDLLDQPDIAVGIVEREKRPVARVLRVGAGLPCLDGERRSVPHVTRVDATADELVMGRFDVRDDQTPLGRARRGGRESLAEGDRTPRAWGCELDDAKAL